MNKKKAPANKKIVTNVIELDVQSFFDSIPIAMSLVDPEDDFRIVMTNKYFDEAVGEVLQGKRPKDLKEHRRNKTELSRFEQVARSKKALIVRGTRWEFEGKVIYYDNYFYPIFGKGKTVKFVLGMAVDVTQANLDAENLKHERDLRDSFLSHLSHDLNQPLYIAKTCFETIEKRAILDDVKKLAAHGLTGIRRTESMIKNLLDAYYLEAKNKNVLKLEEFEPCEIARTMVDLLRFIHGDRFILQEKKFSVIWDRDAFTRILDNLLSNAVKYGRPDSPIRIIFQKTPSKITMTVHNEGSYISPQDLDKIFRMYERGKSGKGKEGWGIGLSVVKKLAEIHGGSVRVESSKTSGTSFIVGIPRKIRSVS